MASALFPCRQPQRSCSLHCPGPPQALGGKRPIVLSWPSSVPSQVPRNTPLLPGREGEADLRLDQDHLKLSLLGSSLFFVPGKERASHCKVSVPFSPTPSTYCPYSWSGTQDWALSEPGSRAGAMLGVQCLSSL